MFSNKIIHLFAAAILAVAASGSAASAGGRVVQIDPNLIPNNTIAGQLQTAPTNQLRRCQNQRWYGKAELFQDMFGVPLDVPDWVKNKLLPEALHGWEQTVRRDLGGDWAVAGNARSVQTQVQFDSQRHVWWANWSAIPCRK